MKVLLIRLDFLCSAVLFSPIAVLKKWVGFPLFLKNLLSYRAMLPAGARFPLLWSSVTPILGERFESAGAGLKGHYFLQDLHVAQQIAESKPSHHVDVGSRVDGFVAHLLVFFKVTYVDIRPMPIEIKNLNFKRGLITQLPFADGEVQSLSSLHVLEHIGLGRYGDPVDPEGYLLAARELQRVVAPGGNLFLSVPVGKEKLYYDAHRVFAPSTVVSLFPQMRLVSFHLIDDLGESVQEQSDFQAAGQCDYGCGIFRFEKL